MKKLLHTLLLFAVGLFAACQAPTSGGDVYLNDFLDDLTAQTDAGPAIRAALSHCARIRAARLILPGGELRIRPDLAVEKYQFISNNDEGLKRIAFDLVGLQDFTIEGADTKLLFTVQPRTLPQHHDPQSFDRLYPHVSLRRYRTGGRKRMARFGVPGQIPMRSDGRMLAFPR